MRRGRAAFAAAALALVVTLGGCGDDDPSRFSDEVSAVEEAVEAGDRGAAVHALDVLRIEIVAAKQAGELDAERSAELEALLYESRVLLDAVLPEPSTTQAPPPTDPPTTQAERPTEAGPEDDDEDDRRDGDDDDEDKDDEDDEDDEGPGNGRGRARGHDD